MFSQKWEKAPPLLSDCRQRFDLTFLLSFVQRGMFVGGRQFLVWGMSLFLGGCSLDSTSPRLGMWQLSQIMPVVEASPPSIINISEISSEAPISSVGSTNSESSSGKNTSPSESGNSQQHVPAASEQKPTILVPDIPDKDNGQMIVTYKSKIEETQNLLRTINESQLTKEQHDTLKSINSFLEKAHEAFSQDNLSMAVNLSEKAHTLAKEIVNHSTK